jgi:hypothetical protein
MLKAPRAAVAAILGSAVLAAGCGGGGSSADASRPAPSASDFPAVGGQTLQKLLKSSGATSSKDVAAPAQATFEAGDNRFGFGVFTVAREQISDADVALYVAPSGGGKALGPFPARVESLAVEARFQSKTTSEDPDAAKDVYVADVRFPKNGAYDVVAMIRSGDALEATVMPSVQVGGSPNIPRVGERAPVVHTPTAADVGGDLSKIDTRDPHDNMHDVDLADALGKKPVVLLFATPALCQSRVCGPVVDIEDQVKSELGDEADFIHMEVYANNDPNSGYRPQLRAYGLRTEPWLFVMDRSGRITTRIEGAFSVTELEKAVREAVAAG